MSGPLLLLAAAVAFVAFTAWQHRLGAAGGQPLMNLGLFAYRSFAMGSLVAFIYGTALFGSTYLLPVYMQLGLGLSPSYVGTILMPAGFALAITILLVGRLADRVATHWLVTIGLALLAISFALMFTLGLDTTLLALVALAILSRVGLGFILPSLNLGSMRPLHAVLVPQGSSAINFLRMLGGAAGVSLCGIVLEWRIAAHGDSLANTRDQCGPAGGLQRGLLDAGRAVRAGDGGRLEPAARPHAGGAGARIGACASYSG